ncbi:MAG: hypothetical protein LUE98_09490 [Tannerellaceae bacterium]|nr:hypothetical protein [Tannerellaceae bacterium]
MNLINYWSYNYFTKEEQIRNPESESDKYNLSLLGREMAKIKNYEIVFFHHNRVVVLRNK